MKRKLLSRVSAVAMASAMMVSMFGMSVSAEEDYVKNVEIGKTITKEANVYTPNTTFTFSVRPANATEIAQSGKVLVKADLIPEDGVEFEDSSIKSTPSGIGDTSVTLTDKATLKVNESEFTTPGIYRYVITEDAGSYDGISYTDEAKYFDVYVDKDGHVYSYMVVDESNDIGKDDGIFVNDYSSKHDTLKDLTITKDVTGNQGDTKKDFTFYVTVTGEDNEQYYMVFSDGTTASVTLTSGNRSEAFALADGEFVTIYGLDSDDTYVIEEANYKEEGYTTTIKGADKVGATSDSVVDVENNKETSVRFAEGTVSGADETVTYTNDKEVSTPTGIIMNIAPYIILVAFAGIAALVFLRRRNREF